MVVRHCLVACASVVSPIEIFAADEVGRRRHWSDEDKVRIVEESLRGCWQGSATARRYGISRSLLSIWRREYRSGTLGAPDMGGGFVPLVMESAPSESAERPSREAEDVRIDITLTNGHRNWH
ncbi:IS66 family insertion sequence hypothetical protein [Cereibacter changlensis JA139]|uniref:Transposase n=1 Tax=Cereibacter changlensis JA139 TaxID=1188249 RepID=A0A2T4JSF8_9RHOB|nr:IS66 family insertion sequence hypothetical protein [Cereibacter changlensis JA139]